MCMYAGEWGRAQGVEPAQGAAGGEGVEQEAWEDGEASAPQEV